MLRNTKGFTLIELMIVVLIIGILAAIAIPNFVSMQDRAKEGSVKSNMHTLQLAVEDFAVTNDGVYPLLADAGTVEGLLPGAAYPDNPFTAAETVVNWAGTLAAAGTIAVAPTVTTYVISGQGKSAALALALHN